VSLQSVPREVSTLERRRAPLSFRTFGVRYIAGLVTQAMFLSQALGCTTPTASSPKTVQERCGFQSGWGVSREQALCIAHESGAGETADLQAEMMPSQPGERSSRWKVFPRLSSDKPRDPTRRILVIDMKDGAVLRNYPVAQEPIGDAPPPSPAVTP
jgi:hypothetical protein